MSYLHAGGIDRPLAITKEAVGTVVPHQNWRGMFAWGSWGSGSQVGQRSDCMTSVQTNCLVLHWPGYQTSAYHADGNPGDQEYWLGSLVGGQRDASGQIYMRNRYYNPASGQFTQTDPIGLAGGLNVYGFAAGDPVSYSDPYGLCPEDVTGEPCAGPLGEDAEYRLAGRRTASGTNGSRFGATRDGGRTDHTGIDLATEGGEPVYAAGSGVVTRAGNRGASSGQGVQIRTRGTGGEGTIDYFHMGSVTVGQGDTVKKGDLIGYAGAGGAGSGIPSNTDPHLDFKVRSNGKYVDPARVTPALQGKGLEGIPCRNRSDCK